MTRGVGGQGVLPVQIEERSKGVNGRSSLSEKDHIKFSISVNDAAYGTVRHLAMGRSM